VSRRVYGTATVIGQLAGRGYWKPWERRVRVAARRLRDEDAPKHDTVEVDFSRFSPDKYLLTHATIVGGVEPDPEYGYIATPHGQWVNDNGNAWWNEVLLQSYPTFILAHNYQEHIQLPILSKGRVLDAVAWVVRENFKGEKEPIPTVFIDILVATKKAGHDRLISDIVNRRIKTLSMGTDVTVFQCSRCLRVFRDDDDETCEHLQADNLGRWFRGRDGKKHRQAEMCGHPKYPGSNRFTESSWVLIPAFEPANIHAEIQVGDAWVGRPLRAHMPRERYQEALTGSGV
jgi:hypothetical protein